MRKSTLALALVLITLAGSACESDHHYSEHPEDSDLPEDFDFFAASQKKHVSETPKLESKIKSVVFDDDDRVEQRSSFRYSDKGTSVIGATTRYWVDGKQMRMAMWFTGNSEHGDKYTVLISSNFNGANEQKKFEIEYTGRTVYLFRNKYFGIALYPPPIE